MKYYVTYKCGHAEKITLYGNESSRKWQLEKKAEQLCPDCYKAEQLAIAKQSNADLPALEGSEKQIEWAEQIRAKKLPVLKTQAEKAQQMVENLHNVSKEKKAEAIAKIGEESFNAQFEAHIKSNLAKIQKYETAITTASAAWWIDNRD